MTNTVHFQPICFLCALDEVSDESNLCSAPHSDNEQYVLGKECWLEKVGLPQWALWWMRAIIVDACDFCSMWIANIGPTPHFLSPSFSPIALARFSVLHICVTHLKVKKFSSSDIQVAQFQQQGKDLLCDNWSPLLATGVQLHVLREWHMEACVFACVSVRVVVVGGFHLSSALRPIWQIVQTDQLLDVLFNCLQSQTPSRATTGCPHLSVFLFSFSPPLLFLFCLSYYFKNATYFFLSKPAH